MQSPSLSVRSLSSSGASSPRIPGTPATARSILFDGFSLEDDYILVTGGLGFIGSHTTLELLKANYNVIIIDDLSNAFVSVLDRVRLLAGKHHEANGTQMPQVELHAHDYRDSRNMRELLERFALPSDDETPRSRIKGVIHFAAYKAVEESIKQPLKYYSNNVSGLIDFTMTLGDFGIKNFIFSSSATVYGTLANAGVPLTEDHCVHRPETVVNKQGQSQVVEQGCTGITNPYGRTKWMCEAILADLAASDSTWTIVALRYFNPIGCDVSGLLGEDPKGVPSNLLPVVTKVMTGQYAELSMFGTDWDTPDGTAVRDFIHVTDLARGHIAALSTAREGRLVENFRTFNLGTGNGNSVMDVVTAMESVSKKPIAKKAVDRRAGDVGSCVAMADRSAAELDWKTEKTLTDACRDICNFLEVNAASS